MVVQRFLAAFFPVAVYHNTRRLSLVAEDTFLTEGKILLDGENILAPSVDVIDVRRRVGMVFQRPNPFPKSIYDNVAYGPKIAKTDANGIATFHDVEVGQHHLEIHPAGQVAETPEDAVVDGWR